METKIHVTGPDLKKNRPVLQKIANWSSEKLKLPLASLNVIITDDIHLREMHKRYLDDDSPTDVLTFNLGKKDAIEGEIYISLDRAKDQAALYNVSLLEELSRLIIHGILHLAGLDDQNAASRREMKKKEDLFVREAIELYQP